jgi:hypothetical protein
LGFSCGGILICQKASFIEGTQESLKRMVDSDLLWLALVIRSITITANLKMLLLSQYKPVRGRYYTSSEVINAFKVYMSFQEASVLP